MESTGGGRIAWGTPKAVVVMSTGLGDVPEFTVEDEQPKRSGLHHHAPGCVTRVGIFFSIDDCANRRWDRLDPPAPLRPRCETDVPSPEH